MPMTTRGGAASAYCARPPSTFRRTSSQAPGSAAGAASAAGGSHPRPPLLTGHRTPGILLLTAGGPAAKFFARRPGPETRPGWGRSALSRSGRIPRAPCPIRALHTWVEAAMQCARPGGSRPSAGHASRNSTGPAPRSYGSASVLRAVGPAHARGPRVGVSPPLYPGGGRRLFPAWS